jgi:LuxR family maltose regulon positive regulatory protein
VAIDALTQRIMQQPERKGLLVSRQVITLAFVHLLSGNLKEAALYSRQLGELANTVNPAYITSWSQYLAGCCYFQAGKWLAAERCFRWMMENRYIAHMAAAMSSMIGLSLTLHFMGRQEESHHIAQNLLDFAMESKDPNNMVLAQSAQARLDLLQGDTENSTSLPEVATMATAFVFIEAVPITQCRLRVAGEGGASAIAMIERLQKETEGIHNTYHLIDLVAMKAIAFYQDDRLEDAEKCMEQVLDLAAPGGWIRPFVELGPPMQQLLNHMKQRNPDLHQIDQLLNAFGKLSLNSQSSIQQAKSVYDQYPFDSLTDRELDVLELLNERLQSKEIADKLNVSITTVKTHLRHIYEKLAVNSRRQAVQKAQQLGLLNKK